MFKAKKKGIIALDADGVMLDYNSAFQWVYLKGLGISLTKKAENYFHAHNMFGLEALSSEQKSSFYKLSHKLQMWKNMTPIEGAVEAVNKLVEGGYEVVCVTSMPAHYEHHRLHNLKELGFKINRVIATSRKGAGNPKKSYIEELAPQYFADDLVKNFDGITGHTKLVYIDRNYMDSPNKDYSHVPYHLSFPNLEQFSDYVLKPKNLKENDLDSNLGNNVGRNLDLNLQNNNSTVIKFGKNL